MPLRLLTGAKREVRQAARWYDCRQAGLGSRFLRVAAEMVERIESDPSSLPRLETVRSQRDIRRARLPKFPYAVVFEIFPDEVVILAVANLKRRPNYWQRRKL